MLTLEIPHPTARPRPRAIRKAPSHGKIWEILARVFPAYKNLPEFLHRIKAPPYWVPLAVIGTRGHSRRDVWLAMALVASFQLPPTRARVP